MKMLTPIEGEPITVSVSNGMVTLNGNAEVIQTDIMATNGIIYVIDTGADPAVDREPAGPDAERLLTGREHGARRPEPGHPLGTDAGLDHRDLGQHRRHALGHGALRRDRATRGCGQLPVATSHSYAV
jgi:Fasciclin domain